MTRRFAVVGSGPAGLGVLTALLDSGHAGTITLFDIDRPMHRPALPAGTSPNDVTAFYDSVYAGVWDGQKRKFPPPKTHFAETLPKYEIDGVGKIFRSDTLGGLSNFWGGTALPFTDRELGRWPIGRADLDPHYRRMAELCGIAGHADALTPYFGTDFANRPPIGLTRVGGKMEAAINEAPGRDGIHLAAGVNRCMVETRPEAPNSCVRCGECLAGCFRDSIFSTRRAVRAMAVDRRLDLVRGTVRSFDAGTRTVTLGTDEEFGPFDRIYLAAGCPNTTEITLRSLGLSAAEDMRDNAVYVFPIFHLGRAERPAGREPHLSLSNLIVGLLTDDASVPFAQAQVYTNFDYMWRYNVPPRLWPLARGAVNWSRDRLFWGRLYVHGDASQTYAIGLEDDRLRFADSRAADRTAMTRLWPALRHGLNRRGFYVPPIPPLHQRANSHYAATMPLGGARVPVDLSGEVAPGVFVCDSAAFPDLPAVSLTFTIMALANLLTTRSL